MRKCANIYSYMRMPLVIHDFAPDPFRISLYMRPRGAGTSSDFDVSEDAGIEDRTDC
jgi:hypothetical protein